MQLVARSEATARAGCRRVQRSAVCPATALAPASSRRRRAFTCVGSAAAVLEASVQTLEQVRSCNIEIPLVTEQLSEERLLKRGFHDEFTIGETLGQASGGLMPDWQLTVCMHML